MSGFTSYMSSILRNNSRLRERRKIYTDFFPKSSNENLPVSNVSYLPKKKVDYLARSRARRKFKIIMFLFYVAILVYVLWSVAV